MPSNLFAIKAYMARSGFGMSWAAVGDNPGRTRCANCRQLVTAKPLIGRELLGGLSPKLRRGFLYLLLAVALLLPSFSFAANVTAWVDVCTDYQNGVCNAQAWQQVTIPDSALVDSYGANKTALDWFVANQAAVQNVLNNQASTQATAFDPATAGQFFGWGFTLVMLAGVAAWGGGEVLGFMGRVLGGRR